MKKRLLLFLFTMLTIVSAWAYDFEVDGIYYKIESSSDLTVCVSYRSNSYFDDRNVYSGNVVIPESVTYNGKSYSVTSICEDAFYNSWGLTSIIIPSSVTSIGRAVFTYCSELTSIIVNPNNANYDSRDNCNAIIEKSSNTLIAGCRNTIIPESVTSIGENAFLGCTGLTSITIPESITSIGFYAFEYCENLKYNEYDNALYLGNDENPYLCLIKHKGYGGDLTSCIINDKTRIVCDYAFNYCSSLTSINIPESVTSIGNHAFWDCIGLTSITIPSSVTSIGNMAFYNCYRLTSIAIPNSVTSIGNMAFTECRGLTSITIPESITSIGESAFANCSELRSIIVDSNNANYDSRNNCNAIIEKSSNTLIAGCRNTIIPENVTNIGNGAFSGCSGLTSITIPKGVTNIGNEAFFRCSGLRSIIVDPNNANYDSRNNCNAIIEKSSNTLIVGCRNTIIPEGVTSIEKEAFYSCSGLTSITIPEGVTSIGNNAFMDCIGLTSVNIPDGITSIEDGVFLGCKGLTSITIPDGVTSIGNAAFAWCSGLTSINIPEGVKSIGSQAFQGCNSLTSITIPDGVTSIEDYAFSDCEKLDRLTSLAAFPPEIVSCVFQYSGLISTRTVYIPEGTTAIYQKKWGTDLNYIEMPSVELNDDNVGEDNNIDITIVDCTENTITVKISSKSQVDIEIIVNGVKISITDLKALSDVSAVRNADGTYTISGVQTGDVIKFVAKDTTPINDVYADPKIAEGIYDVTGRKISAPQRGINIINGQKVIVK